MAAKFEIKKTKSGQYMFNLKAGNGQIILTSEMYNSKSSAENGIASVKANASADERFERKTNSAGSPYFVLLAANKQVIGKSEAYSSNSSMENGIRSVKENAASAGVEEVEA